MVLIVRVSSVSDGLESAKYQRIFLNGLQTEGCGVKKKKQKARPAAEVREKLPAAEETTPPSEEAEQPSAAQRQPFPEEKKIGRAHV